MCVAPHPWSTAHAATSTTIGFNVENTLVLDMSGCQGGVAGITSFGALLPGTSAVTSADCDITFGASSGTAMLKAWQLDEGGSAMVPEPSAGVLSQWSFNDTFSNAGKNDSSGHPAMPLAAPNDPEFATGAPGRGNAVTFDGNDGVRISDNRALHDASGQRTVDLWFRTSSIAAVECPTLFYKGRAGTSMIILGFRRGANELYAELSQDYDWPGTNAVRTAVTAAGLTDNQWHHVAFTIVYTYASGVERLYVDGVLRSTETRVTTEALGYSGEPFRLGHAGGFPRLAGECGGPANTWFTGDIDEVRWSSGVRTPSEIASYVNGTVDDYDQVTNRWSDSSESLFGACLRGVSGPGVIGTWTVDADSDCTANDSDPWHPIAPKPYDAGAKVAASTVPGTVDARALLRFGARPTASTAAGNYGASIMFDVRSPDV